MTASSDASRDAASDSAAHARPRGPTWRGKLRRTTLTLMCGYLGIVVMMSLLENMLVYPAPTFPQGDWEPPQNVEEAEFRSSDGTLLHGWLLKAPQETDTWILYCHGNGEHVANVGGAMAGLCDELEANIFVFDYRGYGRSEGKPHEEGVLADGLAASRWLQEKSGLPAERLVLMGRSLGGAVAIDLAAKQGARALVLERTFTRITDAAADRFWWLPVRWIMRNRFPSIEKIGDYDGPLLISHGTEDRIVPYSHAPQLLEAAGTPSDRKRLYELPGMGHNGPSPPSYYRELKAFLEASQD